MDINLILTLLAGAMVAFACFSTVMQRASLPGPLLCLGFGLLIGPHMLDLLRIQGFGFPPSMLALGLVGVALRLPHG